MRSFLRASISAAPLNLGMNWTSLAGGSGGSADKTSLASAVAIGLRRERADSGSRAGCDARLEVEARRPVTRMPRAPERLPMMVWWCLMPVGGGGGGLSSELWSSSDMGGLEGCSSSGQRAVSAREAART